MLIFNEKDYYYLAISIFFRNFALAKEKYRGVEQLVARQAHNLEVACSSPASATKEAQVIDLGFTFYSTTNLLSHLDRYASVSSIKK